MALSVQRAGRGGALGCILPLCLGGMAVGWVHPWGHVTQPVPGRACGQGWLTVLGSSDG